MSTPPEDRASRLEFAISLAREGGELTLDYFQSETLDIETKPDLSYVTEADRRAEELMRRRIAARYPDDAVVGEEQGTTEGDSGWTWYLDPLDGTAAFVRGVPLYGTLVACARDERGDLGVIYLPALAEIAFASRGSGAWWANHVPTLDSHPGTPDGARQARVSAVSAREQACLITTHNEWWAANGRGDVLRSLLTSFGTHRMWGHCYGSVMVATGRADVFVEPSGHDWDFAAARVIVEEAGGIATSVQGEETFKAGSFVATNGRLHQTALDALRDF